MNGEMNNWVLSVLLMLVVISAFAVVGIKHLNRMAFIESQNLLAEKDELLIGWRQLKLSFNAFGSHSRVQSIAHRDLEMIVPPKEQIKVVIYE